MKEVKEMNRKQIIEYIIDNYKNNKIKFEFQEDVLEMISENEKEHLNIGKLKNKKEIDYELKFSVQALEYGVAENEDFQKMFAFNEDEAMKYVKTFYLKENSDKFYAEIDRDNIADGYFGHASTFIKSRKHQFEMTLQDIEAGFSKNLLEFEKLANKITENKDMEIISEGHHINVFKKNKQIYKINIVKDNPEKIKEIFLKN
jgi:hypothetical protein